MGHKPTSELCILLASARQPGDESSSLVVDEGKGSPIAQLTVGDVEEVRATDEGAQSLLSFRMGTDISCIAISDSELYRHAFESDSEDPQQLFEVGSVVFRVMWPAT
jgi:hypothetical protein